MRFALVLFVTLAARAFAAPDYTIVRRTTVRGDTQQQTEYWTRKRFVADDPGQRTIVDFAADRVTVLDKDERTYFEIPLHTVANQLRVLGGILEHLPPAARDAVGLGGKVTLSPNGNRTTIAGRRAEEYGIGGDGVTGWVWLAPDLDPAAILGDEAAKWWRAGGPLAIGPLAEVARAIAEDGIKGMPMWASITAGSESGTFDVDSKIVSVREEASPPDVGKVPAGYRKTASPLPD